MPCSELGCPCQDGDICNYEDDPVTGTKAMQRPTPRSQEQPGWEPKPGDVVAVKRTIHQRFRHEPAWVLSDAAVVAAECDVAPWRSAEEIAAYDELVHELSWLREGRHLDIYTFGDFSVVRKILDRLEVMRRGAD